MILKKILFSVLISFLLIAQTVFADDYAEQREQVKQLVESGVAYLQAHGVAHAKTAFSDPKGKFIKGDLYLFVINFSNMLLIQGADTRRNHIDISHLTDKNGHYFVQEMTNIAKAEGSGWVKYEWMNYRIGKVMNKESYIERVPGRSYYVGSGFYKN